MLLEIVIQNGGNAHSRSTRNIFQVMRLSNIRVHAARRDQGVVLRDISHWSLEPMKFPGGEEKGSGLQDNLIETETRPIKPLKIWLKKTNGDG